jgi:outer membrane protein assembly factor BamB
MRLTVTLSCLIWMSLFGHSMAQLASRDAKSFGLEMAWQSQVQIPTGGRGIASVHLCPVEDGARQYAEVVLPGKVEPRKIRKFADVRGRNGEQLGMAGAKAQAVQEAIFYSWDTNFDGQVSVAEATTLGKGFTTVDRDRNGRITASEYAQFLNWMTLMEQTLGKRDADAFFKARGLQGYIGAAANSSSFEVKEGTLVNLKVLVVSQSGVVSSMDAETGNIDWTNTCGSPDAPAYPAAVNKSRLALVQDGHLYVLDLATGSHITLDDGQRSPFKLPRATSNAVAVTNEAAFVADRSGRVSAYQIGKKEFNEEFGYALHGNAMEHTISLLDQDICAMATSLGYLYVFKMGEKPGILWRYESSSPVRNCIAAANGSFYVGTDAGKFTKMVSQERDGKIIWEYLSSQPLSTPPLVVGSHAYFASDSGTLFCVDDETGFEIWRSNATVALQPLVVIGETLLCFNRSQELVGFDIHSGEVQRHKDSSGIVRTGVPLVQELGQFLVNQLSDRLYLVGASGQVQCFRPIGSRSPVLVESPSTKPIEATKESPFNPAAEEPASDTEMSGADPFGGDPQMEEAQADPFGAPDQ